MHLCNLTNLHIYESIKQSMCLNGGGNGYQIEFNCSFKSWGLFFGFVVCWFVVVLGGFFKKRSNPNNTERKPHNIAKPSFVFP